MKKNIKEKRIPDVISLSKLSEKELRVLANLKDSAEGKVLLTIIDTYVYNRMVDVYKRRSGTTDDRAVQTSFDQGCGAGVTHLKLALLGAERELERRENVGKTE